MRDDTLAGLRGRIDEIDDGILTLFLRRMETVAAIAQYKKETGAPILDAGREDAVLARARGAAGAYAPEAEALFRLLMQLSRDAQRRQG